MPPAPGSSSGGQRCCWPHLPNSAATLRSPGTSGPLFPPTLLSAWKDHQLGPWWSTEEREGREEGGKGRVREGETEERGGGRVGGGGKRRHRGRKEDEEGVNHSTLQNVSPVSQQRFA